MLVCLSLSPPPSPGESRGEEAPPSTWEMDEQILDKALVESKKWKKVPWFLTSQEQIMSYIIFHGKKW